MVVVCCLSNGWPCQQWACISVGVGCLGNGWLRQQWACISVGAGCLGSGGRPSPTECLKPSAQDSLKPRFCSSHWVSQMICPCDPLAGPLSKSGSVSSPALSSLRLPVQWGTRTSTPCGERWVGPAAATLAAGFARRSFFLVYRVSSSLGNFPIPWATKISLEMPL